MHSLIRKPPFRLRQQADRGGGHVHLLPVQWLGDSCGNLRGGWPGGRRRRETWTSPPSPSGWPGGHSGSTSRTNKRRFWQAGRDLRSPSPTGFQECLHVLGDVGESPSRRRTSLVPHGPRNRSNGLWTRARRWTRVRLTRKGGQHDRTVGPRQVRPLPSGESVATKGGDDGSLGRHLPG